MTTAPKTAAESPSDPLARLGQALGALPGGAGKSRGLPPVERWDPPFCGDIDMRIAQDGTWSYMGSPIARPALVRLFASVLRRDPERYVLVTPVERVGIAVEDVPFLAVEMECEGHGEGRRIAFRTNMDELVEVDDAHSLRFETDRDGGVKPYVLVRGGLWARLTRALALDLIELGEERVIDGATTFGVAAAGRFVAIPLPRGGGPLTRGTPCPSLAEIASRLRAEPPGFLDARADLKGDHSLDAIGWADRSQDPPRVAAVLVPMIQHSHGPTLLLTERATGLRQHSGQIAFPGGKVDPEDASPIHTALREAEEEIGLDRAHVRPLGYLDAYLSGTNFFVLPVVAAIAPGFTLALNPGEVASAFEVPVGFLMDERNQELHVREFRGRIRQYYAMPFGQRYIWGVTAGILRNMYERLYADASVAP